MDKILERAVEAARARHPDGEWERLLPTERTEAIYREMRRIDAERAETADPVASVAERRKRKLDGSSEGFRGQPHR